MRRIALALVVLLAPVGGRAAEPGAPTIGFGSAIRGDSAIIPLHFAVSTWALRKGLAMKGRADHTRWRSA
jgi:hypothetical protein